MLRVNGLKESTVPLEILFWCDIRIYLRGKSGQIKENPSYNDHNWSIRTEKLTQKFELDEWIETVCFGISVYLQIQNDKDGTNIQQYTAHMHIAAYRVSIDVRHVTF